MNRRNKLLWAGVYTIMALFTFSGYSPAQGDIHYPNGDLGAYSVYQNGYSMEIKGKTNQPNPPPWDSLINVISNNDCVKMILTKQWDCMNPERYGSLTLAYYYHFQIYCDYGCNSAISISIPKRPELGWLNFYCPDWEDEQGRSKSFTLKSFAINPCGDLLKKQPFVDIDEPFKFKVKINTTKKDFKFPKEIDAKLYVDNYTYPIIIRRSLQSDSVYFSEIYELKDFIPEPHETKLVFEVKFGRVSRTSIKFREVEYNIDSLFFNDQIPILGDPDNYICLPYNSTLEFGARLVHEHQNYRNDESWWPPLECFGTNGVLNCFYDDALINSWYINFIPGDINTNYALSNLVLPDNGQYADLIQYDFYWSLNLTIEREINRTSRYFIYNGIKARPIYLVDPPEDLMAIPVGDSLNCRAEPWPDIDFVNDEFEYNFFFTTDALTTTDASFFDKYGIHWPTGHIFVATEPGFYYLSYSVTHIATGAISPAATFTKVGYIPKVKIISPANNSKFTYDASNPGLLDITFVGETYTSTWNDSIVWSMEPIGNSTLLTPPSALKGDTVTFSYQGLPNQNVDFGPKRVIASLPAYNVSDTVTVLIFFPRLAANHPNDRSNEAYPYQNWYYYWSQVLNILEPHMYCGPDCVNDPNLYGYYFHNGAYSPSQGQPFYHVCYPANGIDSLTGNEGIDTFTRVCIHENSHYSMWWNCWHSLAYDSTLDDPDRDFIPSAVEIMLVAQYNLPFDPGNKYSFDNIAMIIDDDEYLAILMSKRWATGSVDLQDWANPGHQY